MALANLGSSLTSNLAGTVGLIEHGVFEFTHLQKRFLELEESETVRAAGGISDLSVSRRALNAIQEGLQDTKLNSVINNNKVMKLLDLNKKNTIMVAFNPQSITVSAESGGEYAKTTLGKDSGSVSMSGMERRIDTSFRIFFEDVNNKDAFAADKLLASTTEYTKDALALTKALTGTSYSVRSKVELFHAVLKHTEPCVRFTWGNFSVFGQLTRFNSTYTMFNTQGEPIKATANITITATNEGLSDETAGLNNDYFSKFGKDFNELFADNSTVAAQGLTQSLSSIINI